MDKRIELNAILKIFPFIAGVLMIASCNFEINERSPDPSILASGSVHDNIDGLTGNLSPFELLDEPEYLAYEDVNFLTDSALVFIFKSKSDEIFIYPHQNLLVEIVNDVIGDIPVAINFCPLTGTGMVWDRRVGQDTLLMRASGLLYRDNLVIQDSISGTLWLQMKKQGVYGPMLDHQPKTLPLVQTTWQVARDNFRNGQVFIHDCDSICGPRNLNDPAQINNFDQYDIGELVYGITDPFGNVNTYHSGDYEDDFVLVQSGQNIIAIIRAYNVIVSFRSSLKFEPIFDSFPLIMQDESGSKWNLFGEAIEGPLKGKQLEDAGGFYAFKQSWELVFFQ